MKLKELRKNHRLIDLFVTLCEIPSPSLKEAHVAEKITEIFEQNNIAVEYDDYKNIIARIPATKGCEAVPALLLSAHMDVVGDDSPVSIRLSEDEKYIETDKTRTLGSDNKAGVAGIIDVALEMGEFEHGPVEITFTRDEEKGMTGIKNLDTAKLNAKYAIVADGEQLGELDVEGAGFTNFYINIFGGKGGHSGINIHETDRISAIKVMAEVISGIPQGVWESDPEKGVITSINAGLCHGGEVKTGFLNVIASDAKIAYSIRSSRPESEKELIDHILSVVDAINDKYKGLITVEAMVEPHLKPFIKDEDGFFTDIIINSAKNTGINSTPSSFHAGAETHILADEKKNAKGEVFKPVIVGLANLKNIHSRNEKIDWESFIQGRNWLAEIIAEFCRVNKA